MENNQAFEKRIRAELKQVGNNIKPSDELYSNIMTHIKNNKQGRIVMFKDKFRNMGTKKVAAAILCLMIAVAEISFSTSSSLCAFAAETLHRITTIFLLDNSNKIVEKDANKFPLTTFVSKTSDLSDTELSKKVGYKVIFPEILGSSLKLREKAEAISLENIDYATWQNLQKDAFEAIDDMDKFHSLEKYNPKRNVSAMYENADDRYISISIMPNGADYEKGLGNYKKKIVDVNGIKGYWVDIPMPVYPKVKNSKIGQADMTKKPTKVEIQHELDWIYNGLCFTMPIPKNQDYSMEQVVNAAKEFMASYIK